MKILIACERSGTVREEFRKLGHDAWSCDLVPADDGSDYHIQDDVSKRLLYWDMIIAFPPCTHLAVSGAAWFEQKIKDGRQQEGIDFFMMFANADCPKIAIENPIGIMSRVWRKPDQIIQPWQFGDSYQKSTCLWLKGLPKLVHTEIVDKGEFVIHKSGKKKPKWFADAYNLPPDERARVRSQTFPGIGKAMAVQWGRPVGLEAFS